LLVTFGVEPLGPELGRNAGVDFDPEPELGRKLLLDREPELLDRELLDPPRPPGHADAAAVTSRMATMATKLLNFIICVSNVTLAAFYHAV
jgi:hypothetical protein